MGRKRKKLNIGHSRPKDSNQQVQASDDEGIQATPTQTNVQGNNVGETWSNTNNIEDIAWGQRKKLNLGRSRPKYSNQHVQASDNDGIPAIPAQINVQGSHVEETWSNPNNIEGIATGRRKRLNIEHRRQKDSNQHVQASGNEGILPIPAQTNVQGSNVEETWSNPINIEGIATRRRKRLNIGHSRQKDSNQHVQASDIEGIPAISTQTNVQGSNVEETWSNPNNIEGIATRRRRRLNIGHARRKDSNQHVQASDNEGIPAIPTQSNVQGSNVEETWANPNNIEGISTGRRKRLNIGHSRQKDSSQHVQASDNEGIPTMPTQTNVQRSNVEETWSNPDNIEGIATGRRKRLNIGHSRRKDSNQHVQASDNEGILAIPTQTNVQGSNVEETWSNPNNIEGIATGRRKRLNIGHSRWKDSNQHVQASDNQGILAIPSQTNVQGSNVEETLSNPNNIEGIAMGRRKQLNIGHRRPNDSNQHLQASDYEGILAILSQINVQGSNVEETWSNPNNIDTAMGGRKNLNIGHSRPKDSNQHVQGTDSEGILAIPTQSNVQGINVEETWSNPDIIERVRRESMESHSIPFEIQSEAVQAKNKPKRTRGPTQMLDVWDMKDGDFIIVNLDKYGRPIGEEATTLTRFIGSVVRRHEYAPINYKSWKLMPKEYKDEMLKIIESKFEFVPPINDVTRKMLKSELNDKWRQWKSDLKSMAYDRSKTEEEIASTLPNDRVEPSQYRDLVHHWFSEDGQKISEINRKNRAKFEDVHCMGTKSLPKLIDEKKKRSKGMSPERKTIYIDTRTRKDGTIVNAKAARVIEELKKHNSEAGTSQLARKMQSHSSWKDDIYSKVQGPEKRGPVRCLGKIPESKRSKISFSENKELHDRLKQMENLMANVLTLIQNRFPGEDVNNIIEAARQAPDASSALGHLSSPSSNTDEDSG